MINVPVASCANFVALWLMGSLNHASVGLLRESSYSPLLERSYFFRPRYHLYTSVPIPNASVDALMVIAVQKEPVRFSLDNSAPTPRAVGRPPPTVIITPNTSTTCRSALFCAVREEYSASVFPLLLRAMATWRSFWECRLVLPKSESGAGLVPDQRPRRLSVPQPQLGSSVGVGGRLTTVFPTAGRSWLRHLRHNGWFGIRRGWAKVESDDGVASEALLGRGVRQCLDWFRRSGLCGFRDGVRLPALVAVAVHNSRVISAYSPVIFSMNRPVKRLSGMWVASCRAVG